MKTRVNLAVTSLIFFMSKKKTNLKCSTRYWAMTAKTTENHRGLVLRYQLRMLDPQRSFDKRLIFVIKSWKFEFLILAPKECNFYLHLK